MVYQPYPSRGDAVPQQERWLSAAAACSCETLSAARASAKGAPVEESTQSLQTTPEKKQGVSWAIIYCDCEPQKHPIVWKTIRLF